MKEREHGENNWVERPRYASLECTGTATSLLDDLPSAHVQNDLTHTIHLRRKTLSAQSDARRCCEPAVTPPAQHSSSLLLLLLLRVLAVHRPIN